MKHMLTQEQIDDINNDSISTTELNDYVHGGLIDGLSIFNKIAINRIIIAACVKGDTYIIKMCIKDCIDITKEIHINIATHYEQLDIIKLLIENGSDPREIDKYCINSNHRNIVANYIKREILTRDRIEKINKIKNKENV